MINIYLNNILVKQNWLLNGQGYRQKLSLKLLSGLNIITFEGVSAGVSGPLTADMEIYDSKGKRLAYAYVGMGRDLNLPEGANGVYHVKPIVNWRVYVEV